MVAYVVSKATALQTLDPENNHTLNMGVHREKNRLGSGVHYPVRS